MDQGPGITVFRKDLTLISVLSMRELAVFLKSVRLERGITLDSISRNTGMSLSTLKALEAANWDKLDSLLLVKNFVCAYCSALGIDSAAVLEKYAADIRACNRQNEYLARYAKWSKVKRSRTRLGPFGMLLLGIGLAGLASGGVWIVEKRARVSETPPIAKAVYSQQEFPTDLPVRSNPVAKPEPKVEPAPVAPVVETAAPPAAKEPAEVPVQQEVPVAGEVRTAQASGLPSEVLAAGEPAGPSETARKHVFAVAASEKTWIQVEMDGRVTQSAMLHPGETREWNAEKGMRIVVGNLGGVRMNWDGRPVDAPGRSGQVLRFHLPDPQYVKE